jgi:ribosome-associated protein
VASREASAKIALLAARAGLDKKAFAVEIIDLTGKVDYADFLVLMTGSSDRHVASLADAVDELLGRNGIRSVSIEGRSISSWVLIDFVDVVVHVFQHDSRAVYDLDGLWMDASRLPVPGAPPDDS